MRKRKITEPARETSVLAETNVVVCGGGPAGIGAALAAARRGARTVVVENQICLGGCGTSGMLSRLGPYHDQKDIILGGIPWEILEKLRQRGMAGPPTPTSPKDWQNYWLVFDPEAIKLLLDELLQEAGVDVLFNARIVDVIMDSEKDFGSGPAPAVGGGQRDPMTASQNTTYTRRRIGETSLSSPLSAG